MKNNVRKAGGSIIGILMATFMLAFNPFFWPVLIIYMIANRKQKKAAKAKTEIRSVKPNLTTQTVYPMTAVAQNA